MGEFVVRYPIWEGCLETAGSRSEDLFCRVGSVWSTERPSLLRAQGSFRKITIGWKWNKINSQERVF